MAINTVYTDLIGDRMNTKTLLAISTLVLIGMTLPMSVAATGTIQYQNKDGMISLLTEDIGVMIPAAGEVPHFRWWDPNDTSVDFHLMFVKLFEANDTDGDGVFTPGMDHIIGPVFALPTTDWEFSGFKLDNASGSITAVHFNLTSTSTHIPRPEGMGSQYGELPPMEPFNVTVQIRVHIDVQTANSIKFDIIIAGWQWTYTDTILALQFMLTQSAHGANNGTEPPTGMYKEATRFQFSNGYFEYEPTALAAQNTIQVKASHGEGVGSEAGEAIYLAFENFGDNTLVYDPTLGIASDAGGLFPPLTSEVLMIVGGVLVLAIVVGAIFKTRR